MEKRSRSILTIVLYLFVLGGSASCGNNDIDVNFPDVNFLPSNNTSFEAKAAFSFDIAADNRSLLRVQGVNGRIDIRGIEGASWVRITGTRLVGSYSIQDAYAALPDLTVHAQGLANEVLVETEQPQNTGGRRYIVDYTITMPSDMAVQLTSTNGSVTLDGVASDVMVDTVNGDVTLTGIVGSAAVHLANGRIDSEVTLPLGGTIDLDVANGSIDLAIPASTSAGFSAAVGIGSIGVTNLVLLNEVSTATARSGILGSGQGTIALDVSGAGYITVVGK